MKTWKFSGTKPIRACDWSASVCTANGTESVDGGRYCPFHANIVRRESAEQQQYVEMTTKPERRGRR